MSINNTDIYYKKPFEECYIKNYPKIRSFIYGYTHDYDLAKSIAQETFLVLWENREKANFREDLLPYLFFIAKNKSLNVLRKAQSSKKYSSYIQNFTMETLNINALSHSSSTSIYTKEISELAETAIKNLHPKIKETFLLSKSSNLKYSEIATLQKISVKAVEYRISCALKELRKILKDYLPFFIGHWLYILFN